MSARNAWQRATAPTVDGELARRRESVLLSALAGMVALSGVAGILQLVGAADGADPTLLGWMAVNLGVGLGCAGLLRAARAGRHRIAAKAVTGLLGVLAVALLLADGRDHPMWTIVATFSVVLGVMLLDGGEALAGTALLIAALATVYLLQYNGIVDPFSVNADAASDPADIVMMAALLLALVALGWLFTRDVLVTVDQQLARAAARRPRCTGCAPRRCRCARSRSSSSSPTASPTTRSRCGCSSPRGRSSRTSPARSASAAARTVPS